jgi:hypothetical protein
MAGERSSPPGEFVSIATGAQEASHKVPEVGSQPAKVLIVDPVDEVFRKPSLRCHII